LKNRKLKKGQNVRCSIRPEVIRISDSPEKEGVDNQFFKSEILSLIYYGVIEHYQLRSFGDVELKVSIFKPEIRNRQEGDTVYLSFNPENVNIFPSR
jgi:ABC-type Fe3+/spermidine/putrescine transport system ATPase subunit